MSYPPPSSPRLVFRNPTRLPPLFSSEVKVCSKARQARTPAEKPGSEGPLLVQSARQVEVNAHAPRQHAPTSNQRSWSYCSHFSLGPRKARPPSSPDPLSRKVKPPCSTAVATA